LGQKRSVNVGIQARQSNAKLARCFCSDVSAL
jgi:hypothetical protein